jgi:hypothetical protein
MTKHTCIDIGAAYDWTFFGQIRIVQIILRKMLAGRAKVDHGEVQRQLTENSMGLGYSMRVVTHIPPARKNHIEVVELLKPAHHAEVNQ